MPVEILAAGTGAANSTTVTVTAAAPVTVSLKFSGGAVPVFETSGGGSVPPGIFVQSQDDAGAWNVTGESLTAQQPQLVLNRPGVYRLRRLSITSGHAIGAFRSDP